MKPRPTYLLLAALALAAVALGVAALRYMPGAEEAGGKRPRLATVIHALHPAGGAILPRLRPSIPASSPAPVEAPPAAQVPPPGQTAQAPQPEAPSKPVPLPEPAPAPATAQAPAGLTPPAPAAIAAAPEAAAPASATPTTTPPVEPAAADSGVEATVSFPAVAPRPPARPPELHSGETPLPPARPRDLAALETPTTEAPAAAPAAPAPSTTPAPAAPSNAPAGPAISPWSLWSTATPAPEAASSGAPSAVSPGAPVVYADVPKPPSRPADLDKLAAATPAATAGPAPASAQSAVAPASDASSGAGGKAGTQMARLEEPTLKPAPEDAFQPPPTKFGMGDPVFIRIFKQEGQLELWLKRNGRYHLFKTFPICKWSGRLGPKQREADYQSPEGFYSVSAKQLNPHSNYYRAFNVGYPNAFDRQNGRTGGLVMVHGACKSVGCFAMTDRGIEEIYGFVESALKAGQKEIPVHIFPFRMTEANLARETSGGFLAFVSGGGGNQQWAGFWHNLKQGYDLFEQSGEPPAAFACGDHYEFDGGSGACRRVAGW